MFYVSNIDNIKLYPYRGIPYKILYFGYDIENDFKDYSIYNRDIDSFIIETNDSIYKVKFCENIFQGNYILEDRVITLML